jgi:hypothetical protein
MMLAPAAWAGSHGVAGPTDMVYDTQRGLLYVTTSGGQVLRFNPATDSFLTPWTVGVNLHSDDITPDHKYLLTTELSAGASQGIVRKIDLDTGINTNLFYGLNGEGAGSYDIVTLNNGTAVFDSDHQFSGASVLLRKIDLTTFAISPLQVNGQNQAFESRFSMFSSKDGSSMVVACGNTSGGPVWVYSAPTNSYLLHTAFGAPLNGFTAGLSPDGKLIAVDGPNVDGAVQRTNDFSLVEVFPDLLSGAAYDPSGTLLFGARYVDSSIRTYRTSDYQQIAEMPAGLNLDLTGGDSLQVSDDGKWLFLRTPGAITSYALTPVPEPSAMVLLPGALLTGLGLRRRRRR